MSRRSIVSLLLVAASLAVLATTAASHAAGPARPDTPEVVARSPLASRLLALHHASPSDGVVVQPGQDEREAAAVASFVARGGRAIVLADDATTRALGLSLARAPVRETPTGAHAKLHTTDGERDVLVEGRAILGAPADASRVLVTSAASFVDVDGDLRSTAADVPGPFLLGVQAHEGRAIVLGTTRLLAEDWRALAGPFFAGAERVHVEVDAWAAPFGAAALDVAHRPLVSLGVFMPLLAAALVVGWPSGRRGRAIGDDRYLPEDAG